MTQLPSSRAARALSGALDGGHVDSAAAVLDDGSLLHVPGQSGLAGEYQGREAILGLLRWMTELTNGTLRFRTVSGADEDGRGIRFRGRAVAMRQGRRLDTDIDVVVSIRGGKVHEIWISHQDQGCVDEFWS